jgi:hypothetical protein
MKDCAAQSRGCATQDSPLAADPRRQTVRPIANFQGDIHMPSLTGLHRYVWAVCGRKPAKVYYTNGGIGDELMLTAIAAAARAAGRPLHLIATYPDLWQGNSDPASLHTGVERWHYASLRRWIATEVVHLSYETIAPLHIAEQMAAHTGVALPAAWRPMFHSPIVATRDPRVIVVQNSCSGARYSYSTKEWPQERWRELVRRLAGEFRVVQLGTPSDPHLDGAEDLRGRTTLRDAARLLSGAAVFIGLESGLQHLAAGVRTPSVIIYGGRSYPHQTGYPFNLNLTRAPACAGCGLSSNCPHSMVCMDIPVTEVEAAARRLLETAVERRPVA